MNLGEKTLGLWTRYDKLGASSRLRYFAYIPYLKAAGWNPIIHPFFTDKYLHCLYQQGYKSKFELIKALYRRQSELKHIESTLIIEYELMPFLPASWELRYLDNHRWFLNFDDAVWCKYANIPGLKDKFAKLCSKAHGVIVANDELFNTIVHWNPQTIKIPSVIDVTPSNEEKYTHPVICWIGTPITYRFLQSHAEALRAMRKVRDYELLVIAKRGLQEIPGLNMRFVDWSPDTEMSYLCRCHAGIMPLDDDQFSRGKSAFKLIQYLAAAIPSIASPIGENKVVLKPNKTGFFATTPAQWAEAWQKLNQDDIAINMAKNCHIEFKKYSLSKYVPKLLKFIQPKQN